MQNKITMAKSIQDYETFLNCDCSANTRMEYVRTTKAFFMHYFNVSDTMEFGKLTIPNVTEKDIEGWYKSLLTAGLINSSLVRFRQSIKKYFEFARDKYGVKIPNVSAVELPKVELNSDFNVLTDTEIVSLINCAESTRDKLMVTLLYEAGLKRNELINIKKSDIDFDKLLIRIYNTDGKLDRYGYFTFATKELIERYMNEWKEEVEEINEKRKESSNGTKPLQISEYLFQSVKSPQISYAPLFKAIKEMAYAYYYKQAIKDGMKNDEVNKYAQQMSDAVNVETFRHSRRAWHFAQGKTIEQVMAIMGDENSTLCKRYLKIAMKLYPESFR